MARITESTLDKTGARHPEVTWCLNFPRVRCARSRHAGSRSARPHRLRESDRDDSGSGEGGSNSSFVFAGSAEPVALDPFFASDGETFRVSRQIFEGLVGTKPGTADPAPLLATDWTVSEDGLTYGFTLRDDVKFQDGSDFNAEAVCFNFDRWYNTPESAQTEDLTYYYGALFRGYKTGERANDAIYESCTADSATRRRSS